MSEAKLGVYQPWTQGEKNPSSQGKAEFYLDGKRMVVDCIGVWAKENGYPASNVAAIARTNRDGFIHNKRDGKKVKERIFSAKGPLGTITKVKWLVDND